MNESRHSIVETYFMRGKSSRTTEASVEFTRRSCAADLTGASVGPTTTFVDLDNALCPGTMCPAVIGGVLIYRDENHMSATYASTMSGRFAKAFAPLVRLVIDQTGRSAVR